ncbi:transposase [Rickettsia bellii]|uniref:transposase n=1 Tax=Rickettsia bellii TaxID=33990 RepID=UPI0009C0FAE1
MIWIVERSFAWLGDFRRLSKDYEMTTSSAKAFIQLAFSRIMLKNLFKPFT